MPDRGTLPSPLGIIYSQSYKGTMSVVHKWETSSLITRWHCVVLREDKCENFTSGSWRDINSIYFVTTLRMPQNVASLIKQERNNRKGNTSNKINLTSALIVLIYLTFIFEIHIQNIWNNRRNSLITYISYNVYNWNDTLMIIISWKKFLFFILSEIFTIYVCIYLRKITFFYITLHFDLPYIFLKIKNISEIKFLLCIFGKSWEI
jgi:hypothetical protein